MKRGETELYCRETGFIVHLKIKYTCDIGVATSGATIRKSSQSFNISGRGAHYLHLYNLKVWSHAETGALRSASHSILICVSDRKRAFIGAFQDYNLCDLCSPSIFIASHVSRIQKTIVQKTEKLSCLQAPMNDHDRRHHGSNRQYTDTSNQQREPGGNALSATHIQNIVKF